MSITLQNPMLKKMNLTSASEKPSVQKTSTGNYSGKLQAKKNEVSFKGLPAVYTHPIENKIAPVLKYLQPDGIIVVGENANDALKLLKESIGNVKKLINKLFFIEDKDLGQTFAVTKDGSGAKQFLNLTDKLIAVKKVDSKGESTISAMKKENSVFVEDSDTIFIKGAKFQLKESPSAFTPEIRSAVKEFDFSKHDINAVKGLNTKNIDSLLPKEVNATAKKLTFADVGGQNGVIEELKKGIIYPIKYPDAFKNNIVNHGIVLTGGPGTGKTLIAEALANEAKANYVKINASELESKWVGETEKKWRELFQDAKEKQPTIIVIDEADAVFKRRAGSDTSRHDDKAVNTVLSLMSDLEKSKDQVYVVATTNKIELLDEAVLRSGRFGQHIEVKNPDLEGCSHILGIHSKNKPVSENFDSKKFAEKLFKQNTSGADIAKITNDAHANAYNRLGIFEKMEKETYVPSDTENLKIEQADFEKALKSFAESKKNIEVQKNPIGFLWNLNKKKTDAE